MENFFQELKTAAQAYHWKLLRYERWEILRGYINPDRAVCPIECVSDQRKIENYHTIFAKGRAIGLSNKQIFDIVRAADEREDHNPALRQRLIATVLGSAGE